MTRHTCTFEKTTLHMAICLAGGFLCLAALRASAQVPLTRNGEAVAVIVDNGFITPPAILDQYEAARVSFSNITLAPALELQAYLETITGATLPRVGTLAEAGDRPAIILDVVDTLPGASDRATAQQAYQIKTEGNRLVLTATSELGLLLAVYGFLEDHLGCRFYSYEQTGSSYAGPGFEVVPDTPSLTLGVIDDFQEPDFQVRGFIYWLGSHPWVLKNRGGGLPTYPLNATHSFYHYAPPHDARGIKGYFNDHPEWYPMHEDGARRPDWATGLCGTADGLPEAMAANLKRRIETAIENDAYDPTVPIPVGQGDGFTPCLCPDCRALVEREESETAPYVHLLNNVLDALGKDHPRQEIITFAYFATLDAPKSLKPHPNLWLNIVSSAKSLNQSGDQVGPIEGNPANRDYARALREWPTIAPGRVTTWDWKPYEAEWPSIFYLDDIVQGWRENGIVGAQLQFCGPAWRNLHAWVFLKLAWNADLDVETLVMRYLRDHYGETAASFVFDYLKLTQRAYAETLHNPSAVRWSGWTQTTRVKWFPPSTMRTMDALMERALAAAAEEADPGCLQRLRLTLGGSFDRVKLDEAKTTRSMLPVEHQASGKSWLVPGGKAATVDTLCRVAEHVVAFPAGYEAPAKVLSQFEKVSGGVLFELANARLHTAVCPSLRGQIVSLRTADGARELLGGDWQELGYRDMFPFFSQIWVPRTLGEEGLSGYQGSWTDLWRDFRNPSAESFETSVILDGARYGLHTNSRIDRTVRLKNDSLEIERTYVQTRHRQGVHLRNPSQFSTRWLLNMPDHRVARVAVRGGGVDQLLDLRYAVPGGITGVRAGEALPALDAMDARFDNVLAIPDAEVTKLNLDADVQGVLRIQFDRGDGVSVVLETPNEGWSGIELQPVVDKNYLRVTFVGEPVAMDAEAKTVALPRQTLQIVAVPKRVPPETTVVETQGVHPIPVANLRMIDDNRAINERDGMEMIRIPAGEFLRGTPEEKGSRDESPRRSIHMDEYWISRFPVTLAQYEAYLEATGKTFHPTWGQTMFADAGENPGSYPVMTDWHEAETYAMWVGGALPSEAQWEKAARGTDGREYPWGNEWNPDKAVGLERTVNRSIPGILPVGSSPEGVSPYGVEDMAGNAWEWVADWYQYDYYAEAPQANPPGPESGTHKVLRGGDSLWDERFSRSAARMVMPPHVRDWVKTGFRYVVRSDDDAE